jgi:hypothetical protein
VALTSPTSGGRSVCIVRFLTKATEFSLVLVVVAWLLYELDMEPKLAHDSLQYLRHIINHLRLLQNLLRPILEQHGQPDRKVLDEVRPRAVSERLAVIQLDYFKPCRPVCFQNAENKDAQNKNFYTFMHA